MLVPVFKPLASDELLFSGKKKYVYVSVNTNLSWK